MYSLRKIYGLWKLAEESSTSSFRERLLNAGNIDLPPYGEMDTTYEKEVTVIATLINGRFVWEVGPSTASEQVEVAKNGDEVF